MDPQEWDRLPFYMRDLYVSGLTLTGIATRLTDEMRQELIREDDDGLAAIEELASLGLKVQNV